MPIAAAGAPPRRHPRDDGRAVGHRGAAAGRDRAARAGARGRPAGRRRRARCSRRSPIRSSSSSSAASCSPRRCSCTASTAASRSAPVVARRRRQPDADPDRLRRGRHRHLDVDQQHRDDGDDVSDRAVDRRAPDARAASRAPASRNFAIAMMLMAAFGASIGGMGTPVGTPPNLIGIGMLERIAHVHISFFQWMLLGVPLVVLLFALPRRVFPLASARRPADRQRAQPSASTRSCASSGRCRRRSATR